MSINKMYIAIGFLIAFGLFFELAAHADELNQQTTVTFSAPVQIPGQVLPAGTYTLEQADPYGDQGLVRISNADRKVNTMLETVSADRKQPGDTTIILAKPEGGEPEMLVKWFYPGMTTGHEFVYSRQQEREIANAPQETFVGNQATPTSEAAGD